MLSSNISFRIMGFASAALGAVVSILHDFGVKSSGPGVYGVLFLFSCFIFGVPNLAKSIKNEKLLLKFNYKLILMALCIFLFSAGNFSLFESAKFISGVELSSLGRLYIPFCAVLAYFLLGERLPLKKTLLSIIILIVSMAPLIGGSTGLSGKYGVFLCAFAYLLFSVYYSILSKYFKSKNIEINALSSLACLALFVSIEWRNIVGEFSLVPLVSGVLFSLSQLLFYKSNARISFIELNIYRSIIPVIVVFFYSIISLEVEYETFYWVFLIVMLYTFWFVDCGSLLRGAITRRNEKTQSSGSLDNG